MKQQLFCALAVLITSLVAGPAASEIAIGFANPLSGPFAASGKRNQTAVLQAVEDLNERGGVLGQTVRVVEADDACGVQEAVVAATRLVNAGVRFVVGHACSHSSVMAAGIYEVAGVVMITPESTHPRLTEEGRSNVFRLIGRDDRQGAVAAEFLAQAYPGKTIAIVHDGTLYGHGLAEYTREHLRIHGVVEALYAAYTPDQADYCALVTELRAAGVDVLYVGGTGPDAGLILRTAHEQGHDLQLVGGDAIAMEEFWAIAGSTGEGAVFSARPGIHDDLDLAAIRAAFRLRGLGPGTGGMGAYAAVEAWAQAVERAGSDDPAAVADALRHGRFDTVLGPVSFDAKGDLEGAAWQMQIWSDGDYAPLDRRLGVPSQ